MGTKIHSAEENCCIDVVLVHATTCVKIIHRIDSICSMYYTFHIENDFIIKILYVEIIPRICGIPCPSAVSLQYISGNELHLPLFYVQNV